MVGDDTEAGAAEGQLGSFGHWLAWPGPIAWPSRSTASCLRPSLLSA